MSVKFDDFKQFNLVDIFQLNSNSKIQESMVEGMTYIIIDNAFKNPELLVDFLKSLPADTYTQDTHRVYDEGVKTVKDLSDSGNLQIRPPGLQQKVMSEALVDLSFNYYKFLVEQDFIPPHEYMYEDNFSPYDVQSELSGFTSNTQLYYPGMLSVGGNNTPTVDRFQYMFKAFLSDDIEQGEINYYKVNSCDKYWSSVTDIMNNASVQEKEIISSDLNNATSSEAISPFVPVVDKNIFEKIFSIEFKYNRLVLLPGDYFYDVAYDSTKETNCRFTLETGYTDMVTHSKNEQSKEEYYE